MRPETGEGVALQARVVRGPPHMREPAVLGLVAPGREERQLSGGVHLAARTEDADARLRAMEINRDQSICCSRFAVEFWTSGFSSTAWRHAPPHYAGGTNFHRTPSRCRQFSSKSEPVAPILTEFSIWANSEQGVLNTLLANVWAHRALSLRRRSAIRSIAPRPAQSPSQPPTLGT